MAQSKDIQANVPLEKLRNKIGELNQELSAAAKRISALQKIAKAAEKGLSSSSHPIAQLEKVRKQLRSLENLSLLIDIEELTASADAAAQSTAAGFRSGLRRQLRSAAEVAGMPFEVVSEAITVGPFEIKLDPTKGQASLIYGKTPALKGLPADAEKIVAAADKLASDLFDGLAEPATLATEFEQAIKIALTRAKLSLRTPELRAELPTVYRELIFIRQTDKTQITAKDFREYSLARFVVELSSLVSSDVNIQADRSFRLETAVIENTGNRRKSMFIPKDLKRSFGEGTYFQAIVLKQEL